MHLSLLRDSGGPGFGASAPPPGRFLVLQCGTAPTARGTLSPVRRRGSREWARANARGFAHSRASAGVRLEADGSRRRVRRWEGTPAAAHRAGGSSEDRLARDDVERLRPAGLGSRVVRSTLDLAVTGPGTVPRDARALHGHARARGRRAHRRGRVFVHLHPMGTVSAGSALAIELRESGDTMRGRLGSRGGGRRAERRCRSVAGQGSGSAVAPPYAFLVAGTTIACGSRHGAEAAFSRRLFRPGGGSVHRPPAAC